MAFQTVFKRYEKKFIVTDEQRKAFLAAVAKHITPDDYGKSTVCNIYFDTPNYQLIRASIEKPVFKEKLRLRAYGTPTGGSNCFVELKKKYKGVVYKRRISMTYAEAMAFLLYGRQPLVKNKQVLSEINYFISFYKGIRPAAAIFYDREAYYCTTDRELRFTFDSNIRYRTDDFDLSHGSGGQRILENGLSILEIKCLDKMPLWVAHALSENGIYPSSFSKYGTAYKTGIRFMAS